MSVSVCPFDVSVPPTRIARSRSGSHASALGGRVVGTGDIAGDFCVHVRPSYVHVSPRRYITSSWRTSSYVIAGPYVAGGDWTGDIFSHTTPSTSHVGVSVAPPYLTTPPRPASYASRYPEKSANGTPTG